MPVIVVIIYLPVWWIIILDNSGIPLKPYPAREAFAKVGKYCYRIRALHEKNKFDRECL